VALTWCTGIEFLIATIDKYSYEIYVNIPLGCFTYPTYYDSETNTCVETCPIGAYGAVGGSTNDLTTDRARNCFPSKYYVNK